MNAYHAMAVCESLAFLEPAAVLRARRTAWIWAAAPFFISLALILGFAWTRCPWWDEGVFADVAVGFRNSGQLHSSVLAPHSAQTYFSESRAVIAGSPLI